MDLYNMRYESSTEIVDHTTHTTCKNYIFLHTHEKMMKPSPMCS